MPFDGSELLRTAFAAALTLASGAALVWMTRRIGDASAGARLKRLETALKLYKALQAERVLTTEAAEEAKAKLQVEFQALLPAVPKDSIASRWGRRYLYAEKFLLASGIGVWAVLLWFACGLWATSVFLWTAKALGVDRVENWAVIAFFLITASVGLILVVKNGLVWNRRLESWAERRYGRGLFAKPPAAAVASIPPQDGTSGPATATDQLS